MASSNFVMRFDLKTSDLGLFFNEYAAINSKYSLKKSKVSGIKVAVYKEKIIGIQFDSRKTTEYKVISDFLMDNLRISEEKTEAVMELLVTLSGNSDYVLSDTLH